ncbi:hypothetical protein [Olivibacter sp. LS-1]|nr:hypothetical protein [Olivibacter sp. LS-1]
MMNATIPPEEKSTDSSGSNESNKSYSPNATMSLWEIGQRVSQGLGV